MSCKAWGWEEGEALVMDKQKAVEENGLNASGIDWPWGVF
jgi:hypothetical protein